MCVCVCVSVCVSQGRSSMRTDAYALGLTLLQLLSGDAKPGALVARAQAALESCTLQSQVRTHVCLWICLDVCVHACVCVRVWYSALACSYYRATPLAH